MIVEIYAESFKPSSFSNIVYRFFGRNNMPNLWSFIWNGCVLPGFLSKNLINPKSMSCLNLLKTQDKNQSDPIVIKLSMLFPLYNLINVKRQSRKVWHNVKITSASGPVSGDGQKDRTVSHDWDRAFISLKQEIELRHYSKNTFQTISFGAKIARFPYLKTRRNTDDEMRNTSPIDQRLESIGFLAASGL